MCRCIRFSVSLGIEPGKIGFAYGLTGIAAMISPILVGTIADKFFPSQIVLGVLHIVGGVFLFMASKATDWASFFPYIFMSIFSATCRP